MSHLLHFWFSSIANILRAAENIQSARVHATCVGDPDEASEFDLAHLGQQQINQQVENLCVFVSNFAFQINTSV